MARAEKFQFATAFSSSWFRYLMERRAAAQAGLPLSSGRGAVLAFRPLYFPTISCSCSRVGCEAVFGPVGFSVGVGVGVWGVDGAVPGTTTVFAAVAFGSSPRSLAAGDDTVSTCTYRVRP